MWYIKCDIKYEWPDSALNLLGPFDTKKKTEEYIEDKLEDYVYENFCANEYDPMPPYECSILREESKEKQAEDS